ncbi:hypothetical protein BG55_20155 [Erwinia mallotivora]|uniref:Uncharacterized protein n=1 Tax=Erwinia mallotivora TaxID=69222 RepID=A0A014NJC5_9GAMM|nr:hypothetical protein BG55_20155 [Erwinia mallotivora]
MKSPAISHSADGPAALPLNSFCPGRTLHSITEATTPLSLNCRPCIFYRLEPLIRDFVTFA